MHVSLDVLVAIAAFTPPLAALAAWYWRELDVDRPTKGDL